jgi:hypothetical protein
MKYKDVTIIEGAEYVTSGQIKVSANYALNDPIDIQNIEYWEDRLSDLNIPYVLAHVTLPAYSNMLEEQGYVIYTNHSFMTKLMEMPK